MPFAGKSIFLTGATGFIGKVFLCRLLVDHPGVRQVYLLSRSKSATPAHEFFEEFDHSPVSNPLHRAHREGLDAWLRTKITVLSGDLTRESLGLGPEEMARLQAGRVDLVIHLGGYVNLSPELVKAVEINSEGARRVAELAATLGARLLHVSTAFATKVRSGPVAESPMDLGRPYNDLYREAEAFMENSPDRKASGRFARSQGFLNAYCYSKALGEVAVTEVAKRAGIQLSILRPTIVESSHEFPFPGWNEGMTTSAPVVYFMLRGHTLWPIRKPIRFDIIPVDHVVLGLLHVAAAMFQGPVAPVFQLGTSDLPGHLTFGASCAYVSESRRKNKSRRDYGLPVWNWIRTRLPVLHVPLWTYRAFSAPLLIRLLAILPIPGRQDLKKAVYNLHRTIMAYLPFFHDHDFWFVTGNIRKLSPLPEINWREYWIEIHVKGLMKWVFADLAARPERIRGIRSLVRKVLYRLQAWVYRRGFGFDVYGADNIPAGGRVIIAANHASHLDMGLVKQSLGRFGYRMLSLAAEDYFFGSVMKRFYFKNFTTLLPMGRTTNIKTSLKLASDRLRRGYPVLIFPEGTRSADGQIRDFKPSLGYLALRNKAGILPVRLDGTFAAWPKGKVLPRFTRLRATVGPLIRHDRILGMTEGMSHRDAYRVISAETERVVRSLNPDSATLSLNSDSSPDQTRP